MSNLVDSGERTMLNTGALKEQGEDKPRHDLIPLDVLSSYYHAMYMCDQNDYAEAYVCFSHLHKFVYSGETKQLTDVIAAFIGINWSGGNVEAFSDLAQHYEDGAKKYSDRNWEKGIPLSILLQSAVRHLIKYIDGWNDEPHDRAFLWNVFAMLRMTHINQPELLDLPFAQKEIKEEK